VRRHKPLGEVLVDERLISVADLDRALVEQRRGGKPLGQTLVDMGALDERALGEALAEQFGLEFVDVAEQDVDIAAASLLPIQLARRHGVLPLRLDGDDLVVAVHDPADVIALDDVRAVTGRPVKPLVASRADVLSAIERYAGGDDGVADLGKVISVDEEPVHVGDLADAHPDDAPIVRLTASSTT
jgi:type IV pilus assembly protein PilB